MKTIKVPFLYLSIFIFTIMTSSSICAQDEKVGFVDYNYVFTSLLETKEAMQELETYGAELQKELKLKQQELETYYTEIMKKAQEGSLTPIEQRSAEEKIQKDQKKLEALAQEFDVMLMEKEQLLVKPIYTKINDGIQNVAEANNYSVIVKSGTVDNQAMVVYGRDDRNITKQVLVELGIE